MNVRQRAKDTAEAILIKYSNMDRDETHCRMSDLRDDIARVLESVMRSEEGVQEMHDAWLSLQRNIERKKFLGVW